ncbi:unnamed protein product [Cylicostephanus goldi]|uniref:Uncharacterized protein n=1 Tax=Cylicostephanus goldi TaxID=71465 RepID=A0A3P6S017_CYLGO|nr:unnamed protein product [Cylicostephanus goldi]
MFDGGHYSSDDDDDDDELHLYGNENAPAQDVAVENVIDEDSADELAALDAAVNHNIRNGVRQFLRILSRRVSAGNRAINVEHDSSDETGDEDEEPEQEAHDGEPNRNFDVHESSKHQYLFKPAHASEEVDMGATMWLQPGKEHLVPFISWDLVVLPG